MDKNDGSREKDLAALVESLKEVNKIAESDSSIFGHGIFKLKKVLEEKIELLSIEGLPVGAYFIERSEAVPVEGKPYPNEHACRLNDPGKYDRFARKNCWKKSGGKCIDFIFGIKANKSEVQALRYDKKVWSADAARAHCKEKDGAFEAATGKEEGQ